MRTECLLLRPVLPFKLAWKAMEEEEEAAERGDSSDPREFAEVRDGVHVTA